MTRGNSAWTYQRINETYGVNNGMIVEAQSIL